MNRFLSFILVTAMVIGASGSTKVLAQTVPAMPLVQELKPLPAEPTSWHPIRVRNVSAQLMAWWLDPAHNSKPGVLKSTPMLRAVGPAKPPDKKSPFSLPAGIGSVVPVDSQNLLLVWGTESGMRKLESVIALLDKPLRQVEVEVVVVEMKPEELKEFGVTFPEPNDSKLAPAANMGFVRGNFEATLSKLLAQSRAKVFARPHVTAINNQSASMAITYSKSAVLALKDEKGLYSYVGDAPAIKNEFGLSLGQQFNFSVTPTINNDDTITLLLSPAMNLVLSNENSTEPLILANVSSLQTIANVGDGDTLALTGLKTRLIPAPQDAKTPPSNVVLFVRAWITRSMGDEDAVDPDA
jgi:type II secretory pathway component GspD/PulD (secretin)